MSFSFTVPPNGDTWTPTEAGKPLRVIREVNLLEIIIVSWPAYPQTSVFVRMPVNPVVAADLARRRERLEALIA